MSLYDIKDGRIVSPGKFEGQPVYPPHFCELALDGCSDDDFYEYAEGPLMSVFVVTPEDVRRVPELSVGEMIELGEDDQGFVHTKKMAG